MRQRSSRARSLTCSDVSAIMSAALGRHTSSDVDRWGNRALVCSFRRRDDSRASLKRPPRSRPSAAFGTDSREGHRVCVDRPQLECPRPRCGPRRDDGDRCDSCRSGPDGAIGRLRIPADRALRPVRHGCDRRSRAAAGLRRVRSAGVRGRSRRPPGSGRPQQTVILTRRGRAEPRRGCPSPAGALDGLPGPGTLPAHPPGRPRDVLRCQEHRQCGRRPRGVHRRRRHGLLPEDQRTQVQRFITVGPLPAPRDGGVDELSGSRTIP